MIITWFYVPSLPNLSLSFFLKCLLQIIKSYYSADFHYSLKMKFKVIVATTDKYMLLLRFQK